MRRKEVDQLLSAIDKSANSNSYWICLDINKDNQLSYDIVQHLRTGSFHFELVKEGLYRGFDDFSEIIFPKELDTPIYLPKPGNVWNGKEELTINSISKKEAGELLQDLLTGAQKIFSKTHLGSYLSTDKAKTLIQHFFKALDENGSWKPYNIKTDFLNEIDNYYNTNYIQLGYFENCKRDLALAITYNDEVNILLANGYG